MGITHAKVSDVADGADTSAVRPSDWNADHIGEFADPTNATGDMIYRGALGADQNLAATLSSGPAGQGGTAFTNPANAADNNAATWAQGDYMGGSSLISDLGAAASIAAFRVFCTNYPQTFTIDSGDDGTNWTTRFTQNTQVSDTGIAALTFPVTARYWRLMGLAQGSSYWQVATWALFASGSPVSLPIGSTGEVLTVVAGAPSWETTTVASYAPTGLTGATAASRYVGATASGAPVTGTFAVGDFVIDRTAKIWVCMVAGSPGSWGPVTYDPLTTDGDMIYEAAPLGTDWAYLRTVTGNVGNYNGSPANVVDGSDSSLWTAQSLSAGIILHVDLGSARAITRFRVYQGGLGQAEDNRAMVVESSDNDTDWTTYDTITKATNDTGILTLTGYTGAYRYWRLRTTGTGTRYWVIRTFSLWAVALSQQRLPIGSSGEVLTVVAGAPSWETTTGQFVVEWDGGGSVLTAGTWADIVAPHSGTITGWTMLADVSGSAVVDIWRDTYANYPPTDADSKTAAAPPTLTGAVKAASTTLTGWTTSVTAGDVVRFNLDSASTVTRLLLVIDYSRT